MHWTRISAPASAVTAISTPLEAWTHHGPNDRGNWSGYLPHRHPQPEAYFFLFDRPEGFGASFSWSKVVLPRRWATPPNLPTQEYFQGASSGRQRRLGKLFSFFVHWTRI